MTEGSAMESIRIVTGILLYLFSVTLVAQEVGESVTLSKNYQDDLYAAGGTVMSTSIIAGDLVAAGGTLIIDGDIAGDALLIGGDQTITAEISDDLRAAGGSLVVESKVGDDAILAGGKILLSQNSTIGGNALIAGGDVTVAARVGHELRVVGSNVIITGHVSGDVSILADSLQIGDGAVLEGDLNYRSPHEATINPNARIVGNVNYTHKEFENDRGMPSLFALVTMAISAILFYLLFPAFSDMSSRQIDNEFWKSLGFGGAVLLLVPIIAIILMSIVIGVWVALILIAIYLVALLSGAFLGMLYLSRKLAQLLKWDSAIRSKRIIALLISYGVVGVVQFIPVVGGLVTLIIMLIGMGSGLILLYRSYVRSGKVAI